MISIAINGFGRIGRNFLRTLIKRSGNGRPHKLHHEKYQDRKNYKLRKECGINAHGKISCYFGLSSQKRGVISKQMDSPAQKT